MRTLNAIAPWMLPLALLTCGSAPPRPQSLEGCDFQLSPRTRPGSRPPLTDVYLTREDSPGCAWGAGEVWLGSSYETPRGELLASEAGLVVSFTLKGTPSGSAAVLLHLRQVDPETLALVRATSLGALNPYSAGSIHEGVLALLPDGTTLEVRGTKSGVIPGERGEGPDYRATYPDFFTSGAPPAVEAW
jgi:hypothetical protein